MIGLVISRNSSCAVLPHTFGEEPGESNKEWQGQQERKRRVKSKEPLNQFPNALANFPRE
jgi:hypothetical protein